MRDNNGVMITMIVAILSAILFAVLSWLGYDSAKKNYLMYKDAEGKANQAQTALNAANQDVQTLKTIVGYPQSVDVATIKTDHENSLNKYASDLTGNEEQKGYVPILNKVLSRLTAKENELAVSNQAKLDLEDKYNRFEAEKQREIDGYKSSINEAQTKLVNAEKEYNDSMSERKKVKEEIETRMKSEKEQAQSAIEFAKMETAISNRNLNELSKVNNALSKDIQEMKSPVLEKEDGKVLSVNQLLERVTINLGSASGLRPGITFDVFDPENRDAATAKSKGSIEITQIIGPDKAEASILNTDIHNPIMNGDLVYTPVWKPGIYPRFVLSGRMIVQGFGSRSMDDTGRENDLQDVINLIMSNGGIVDFYMNPDGTIVKVDNKIDSRGNTQITKESPANFITLSLNDLETGNFKKKANEIGDELRQDTAFLVVGQGDPMNNKLMSNMKVLDEQAKIHGIRIITLPELLRRMGWKNSTPTHGFGSRANESDLAPRPSKPMNVSRGTVSQLYTDRQGNASDLLQSSGTVSQLYHKTASPKKTSPGTVSPLYHGERKPVRSSNGSVSGIYGGR